jgi:dolichol-phosphate mannosyltransferase
MRSSLGPASAPLLSVLIPTLNEQRNVGRTITELAEVLRGEAIPFEIVVVDDHSTDGTIDVLKQIAGDCAELRPVIQQSLAGFGRAIRTGLGHLRGEIVVVVMADSSDDPADVVHYYRTILQGYDCVFGSRFRSGSVVENYPPLKRIVNRIVNRTIQLLFWTRFNDLTNAFKAYRRDVIAACGPYSSSHFNITLEMALAALIRRYHIAEIPIRWYGRTWGYSKLSMYAMGRRYLSVLLKMLFERLLISDDILAERLAEREIGCSRVAQIEARIAALEARLERCAVAPDGVGPRCGRPGMLAEPRSGRGERS